MRFKPGDLAITVNAPGIALGGWSNRIGSVVTILSCEPILGFMPDGQKWRADYKILFQDGKRGECVEAGLKPYYDGNEKTSWTALKGIYHPNPDKVKSHA